MNIKLAKKVIEHVEKYPEQHEQESYLDNPNRYCTLEDLTKPRKDILECGTTACLTGWALVLSPRKKRQKIVNQTSDWVDAGSLALGIDHLTSHNLFNIMNEQLAIDTLKEMIAEAELANA